MRIQLLVYSACADSPQQSDTLVVPQGRGCEFQHFESPGVMEALHAAAAAAQAPSAPVAPAARRARREAAVAAAASTEKTPARPAGCVDYWAWNQTVGRLCAESRPRRSLFSFVPILPCDAGTFGGVQYVCCANAVNAGAHLSASKLFSDCYSNLAIVLCGKSSQIN